MTQPNQPEPHEGINTDDNVEQRTVEEQQTRYVSRGGTSGMSSPGKGPGPEQPDVVAHDGTASGEGADGVISGVTASKEDVADAVPGDTGPTNPGERRDFGTPPGTSGGR